MLPHHVRRAATLGVLGAISGALAWGAIVGLRSLGVPPVIDGIGWIQLGPFTLTPGVVFGVIVGARLAWGGVLGWRRLAAYALASTASYLLAYHVAFVLLGMVGFDGFVDAAFAGSGGALCGSLALGFFTTVLMPVAVRWVWLSVAVGAAAGALFPLVTMSRWDDIPLGLMWFFALWQAAYGASLAPLLAVRSAPA